MILVIITIVTIFSVIVSRLLFGRLLNPISLYTGIWGGSLMLFELRLINYYPLALETWVYIIDAWLTFLTGVLTVIICRACFLRKHQSSVFRNGPNYSNVSFSEEKMLVRVLWILNIIALGTALQHWYIVIAKFGSMMNVLLLGNLLYSFRVSEGLPGSIPYLSSLALVGALLGGMYTAIVGRIKAVAIIPMLAVILIEVASMGRAKLIMAAILFSSGFFFFKRRRKLSAIGVKPKRFRRVFSLAIAIVLLAVGSEFVRSTRGANENVPYASASLRALQGMTFLTPTVILYLTVHNGVFNQYLKQDVEHTPVGSNTFAPGYRILSKLGFDTGVPIYQKFYKTPAGANTGTYLRELHADFGIMGVLVVPYVIGLLISVYWFRMQSRMLYGDIIVVAYLHVVVAMSIFYIVTRSGDILLSFFVALCCARFLDSPHRRHHQGEEFSINEFNHGGGQ